ncbi:MAG: ribosome silencing factor [Polyangiaceae bacterium]
MRPIASVSNEATRARASLAASGAPEPRARRTRQQDESRRIALLAARAGLEKKAEAVEIIDVTGKVDYADYLVVMTGSSDRNVAAIADAVAGDLAREGIRAIASEGLPLAHWVLIDFVDVVVHVFQREARSVYNLDGLWMDAGRVATGESLADGAERSH